MTPPPPSTPSRYNLRRRPSTATPSRRAQRLLRRIDADTNPPHSPSEPRLLRSATNSNSNAPSVSANTPRLPRPVTAPLPSPHPEPSRPPASSKSSAPPQSVSTPSTRRRRPSTAPPSDRVLRSASRTRRVSLQPVPEGAQPPVHSSSANLEAQTQAEQPTNSTAVQSRRSRAQNLHQQPATAMGNILNRSASPESVSHSPPRRSVARKSIRRASTAARRHSSRLRGISTGKPVASIQSQAEDGSVPAPVSTSPMGNTMRRLFHGSQPPFQANDSTDFATWLRDDLISECRRNGLPTRGRKTELVNRLIRFHGRAAGALARRTSSMETTAHDKGSASAVTSGRAPSDPPASNTAKATAEALSTDIRVDKATHVTSKADSATDDLPTHHNDADGDYSPAKPHREQEMPALSNVHYLQEEQKEHAQPEEVGGEQLHAISPEEQAKQSSSDILNQDEHVLPSSEQAKDDEKHQSRSPSPHPVEDINPEKGLITSLTQTASAELQTYKQIESERAEKPAQHQSSMQIAHGQSAPGQTNADPTKTHPLFPFKKSSSEDRARSQSPTMKANEETFTLHIVAEEARRNVDACNVEMKDTNQMSGEQLQSTPAKDIEEDRAAPNTSEKLELEKQDTTGYNVAQEETHSAIQICAKVNDSGAIQFEPAQDYKPQRPAEQRETAELPMREDGNLHPTSVTSARRLSGDSESKNPSEPLAKSSREPVQHDAVQGKVMQSEPDFMRTDVPSKGGGSSPWQSLPGQSQTGEAFARWKRSATGREEEVARTPDVIDLDADSEGNDDDEEVDSGRSNSESVQDSADESQYQELGETVTEVREEPTTQPEEADDAKLKDSDEDNDEDEDEDEDGDEGISINKKISTKDDSNLNQDEVRGPQDLETTFNEQDVMPQEVQVSPEVRNEIRGKSDYSDEDEDDTKDRNSSGEPVLSGCERGLGETENDKVGPEGSPASMDDEIIDLQEESRMADEDEDEEEKEEEDVVDESEGVEASDAELDDRSSEPFAVDGRQQAAPANDRVNPELLLKAAPSSDSPQRESEDDEEVNQTTSQTTNGKNVIAHPELDETKTDKLKHSEDEADEYDSSKSLDRKDQAPLSNEEDYSSGSGSADIYGTVATKGLITVAPTRVPICHVQSPPRTAEQLDAGRILAGEGPQSGQEHSSDEHKRRPFLLIREDDNQEGKNEMGSGDSNEVMDFSESPLPSPRSLQVTREAFQGKSLQDESSQPSACEGVDDSKPDPISTGRESREFGSAELPSSYSKVQEPTITVADKTYHEPKADSPLRDRADENVSLPEHDSSSLAKKPETSFREFQAGSVHEPAREIRGLNVNSNRREMGGKDRPDDQEVVYISSSDVDAEQNSPEYHSNSGAYESTRNLGQSEEVVPPETENKTLKVVQEEYSQSSKQNYPMQTQEEVKAAAITPRTSQAAGSPSISRRVSQSAKRDFDLRPQDFLQVQQTKTVSDSDAGQAKLMLSGDISNQKCLPGEVMSSTQLENAERDQINRQSVQNFTYDLFSVSKTANRHASRTGIENLDRAYENGSVPSLQSNGSKRSPQNTDGNIASQNDRPQKIRKTNGLVTFCPMPTPDATIRAFASATNHGRHKSGIPEDGKKLSANLERLRRLEQKDKTPQMSSFRLPPLSFANGRIYTQQQYQDQALVFHPGSAFLNTERQQSKNVNSALVTIPRPDKEKFIRESRQRLEAHRRKARSRKSVKSPFLNSGDDLHPLRSNPAASRPSTSEPSEVFRQLGSDGNRARKRVTFSDATDPGSKRRRRL